MGERLRGGSPCRTAAAFLNFPSKAADGEFAVFAADCFAAGGMAPREDTRRTVALRGGMPVALLQGWACVLAGVLPHAVLSHPAPGCAAGRLTYWSSSSRQADA